MTLTETAATVTKLRTEILIGDDRPERLSVFAEQHLLTALALLEQAACALRLADMHEASAMAGARLGLNR